MLTFQAQTFQGQTLLKAKLIETKLNNANLLKANLSFLNTKLKNDFASWDGRYYADISNTNLSGVNFTNADVSYCIIINPISFNNLTGNKNTDFSHSMTTSSNFIRELSFTDKLPKLVTDSRGLREYVNGIDDYFDKDLMNSLSRLSF
jgi:uncharacterized protein YjbI with pentapeptide repeats